MKLRTSVKLLSQEDPRQPLPGITIALYDWDEHSQDDFLGRQTTDAKGEAVFWFDSEAYQDQEDGPKWKVESLPDLYVTLENRAGEAVYSTRDRYLKDQLPPVITILVDEATAAKARS
jgi:hypothetical protein